MINPKAEKVHVEESSSRKLSSWKPRFLGHLGPKPWLPVFDLSLTLIIFAQRLPGSMRCDEGTLQTFLERSGLMESIEKYLGVLSLSCPVDGCLLGLIVPWKKE